MSRRKGKPPLINLSHIGTGVRGSVTEWVATNDHTSAQFWRKIYWAQPPWLTNEMATEMDRIYANRPPGYHVDHIVPLKGDLVCGLHVPWNLQYLPAGPNMSKSNRYWPDCPHENCELFELEPQPHQMGLGI